MFTAYLPFYSFELDNVRFCEQTQDVTAEDMLVKSLLTNDFVQNVRTLGNGLDITGWDRSGLGDLTLMAEWFRDYPQRKEMLKNVRLNGRFGFSFPTGETRDEDRIFAFPFGNDGAVGLVAGGGIDCMMGYNFKYGLDVHLMHVFSNNRERRIKTDPCQTDLLLLAKTCVQREFGLTQRFNLYVEAFEIYKGLSVRAGYQFLKHGDDEVTVVNNEFSSAIANTATSLREWMAHQVEVSVHYDFGFHMPDSFVSPYLALFARIPFNGTRSALVKTVGAVLAVRF